MCMLDCTTAFKRAESGCLQAPTTWFRPVVSAFVAGQSTDHVLACRDVTVVDESRKTVAVTLWREQAEGVGSELEAAVDSHPVVVLSKMRVGDFNGVSLSGTYASRVDVNPEGGAYEEADALREWWARDGSDATFAPAGDAPTRGAGPRGKWAPVAALSRDDAVLSEADPPVFASVAVCVTRVPEAQALYYEANPATNKKARILFPCLFRCFANLVFRPCSGPTCLKQWSKAKEPYKCSGRAAWWLHVALVYG
jgi:Replication protein A OB domain